MYYNYVISPIRLVNGFALAVQLIYSLENNFSFFHVAELLLNQIHIQTNSDFKVETLINQKILGTIKGRMGLRCF